MVLHNPCSIRPQGSTNTIKIRCEKRIKFLWELPEQMTKTICQLYATFMTAVGGQMIHDPEERKEEMEGCYPNEHKPCLQKLSASKTLQHFGFNVVSLQWIDILHHMGLWFYFYLILWALKLDILYDLLKAPTQSPHINTNV